jgi:DHA1 family bicyclomycin/chloramphenicol resistance-like MFS transporter
VLFCIATLICAAAPTIEALIAARALQGVGASGVIVLARAVVRDLYEGRRAGRELALMGMIMGIAPMVGPVIGSLLQIAFGWRAGFFLTFAIGLALIVVVWRLLPETAPARRPGAIGLADFVGAFGGIAKNRSFRSHLAIMSASYAGLFAFISGAPFVMQDVYGLTPLGFGIFFAVTALGFVVGTYLASRLVTRIGLHRTIGYGAFTLAAGGAALVATAVALPGSVVAIGLSIAIYLAGLGLTLPPSMAAALQPFPDRAGAASSFAGFVQQTAGAATGAAVGHALGASAWPLVLGIAVMGFLTLAFWLMTDARHEGHRV